MSRFSVCCVELGEVRGFVGGVGDGLVPLVVVVELVDAEYLGAFDVVYGIVPDHEGGPFRFSPSVSVRTFYAGQGL